jgi:hypothetical protein
MRVGPYLLGVALVAVTLGTAGASAWLLRRALVPSWFGAPARLAETVIAVSELILVGEVLGAVGGLRRVLYVAVCAAVAIVALALCRRRLAASSPETNAPLSGLGPVIGAIIVAALALIPWMAHTIAALGAGMREFDTLSYHMPFAARFVQNASVTGLPYVGNPATTFYPANSELLHAVFLLLVKRDIVSPMLNVGWLGLALLGAWCIGRPWGVGPAAMAATALVASTRIMTFSQAGTAKNDVAALALLLAAIGLLVTAPRSRTVAMLAAVAGGLALGTRLNLIAPVLALAVVATLAAGAGHRRAWATTWAGGLALGGGFWYLRNAVATGNPLPWFGLRVDGLFALPSTVAPVDCGRTSVAHYLLHPAFIAAHLVPHLAIAWGGGWWLLFALALAGAAGGLGSTASGLRALAIVSVVGAVAYVLTPASAGGAQATCFGFNTRFAAPAVTLGLIALPIVLARQGRPRLLAIAAFAALEIIDGQRSLDLRAVVSSLGLIAVVTVTVAGSSPWRRLPGLVKLGVVALLGIGVVAAGWREERSYLAGRYQTLTLAEPVEQISALLAHGKGARIAVSGFNEVYPLYGPALSNRVTLPAVRTDGTRFTLYSTCPAWLEALERGHYQYVVTASHSTAESLTGRWTAQDPYATTLSSSAPHTERQGIPWRWQVYRIGSQRQFDPRSACARL